MQPNRSDVQRLYYTLQGMLYFCVHTVDLSYQYVTNEDNNYPCCLPYSPIMPVYLYYILTV